MSSRCTSTRRRPRTLSAVSSGWCLRTAVCCGTAPVVAEITTWITDGDAAVEAAEAATPSKFEVRRSKVEVRPSNLLRTSRFALRTSRDRVAGHLNPVHSRSSTGAVAGSPHQVGEADLFHTAQVR